MPPQNFFLFVFFKNGFMFACHIFTPLMGP
jgi:hypothetical protein